LYGHNKSGADLPLSKVTGMAHRNSQIRHGHYGEDDSDIGSRAVIAIARLVGDDTAAAHASKRHDI
jgi:hypothetical protein